LKEINLPVILCTFPLLDENYSGDFDLKKAARCIFLTLNKTARKVSESRNILLDDNDIIAYFLRRCLSKIKTKDLRSSYSLRIHNIELDQFGDKLKIHSPIAITGVNHLYYIIEHLLLNTGDEVNGVKPRAGNFSNRTNLNTSVCMKYLNGRNLLGANVANSTKRDSFTADAAEKLGTSFDSRYGNLITSTFEKFALYENHNRAVLKLEGQIESNQDRRLKPILFEGQGISRVFEAHRTNLKEKLKHGTFNTKVPEVQAIAQQLDATAKRIDEAIEKFRVERTELCIQSISDKGKLKDSNGQLAVEVIKWFNDLYENTLTTVAFQSGLICGFFGEIEKARTEESKSNSQDLDITNCFEEYLQQLNDFFKPKTSSQFKKLVRVFTGEISGEITDWKIIPTNQTFREIVYRGEMQPDQWTKYKYLLLEIWKPTHEILKRIVFEERQKCRKQIFSALYHTYKTTYCRENSKLEGTLEKSELADIFQRAFNAYDGFLKTVSAEQLDQQEMKTAISVVSATEINEADSE